MIRQQAHAVLRRARDLVLVGWTLLACAIPAHARTGANVDGRAAPVIEDGRLIHRVPATTAMRAAAPSHIDAINVPLTDGAVQIDSSYYDLQDLGSLGNRIVIATDGTVHLTYEDDFCELQGGCPPDPGVPIPFPVRGMGYARRASGTWTKLGRVQDPSIRGCCVTDLAGGFGTIALTNDGRAAISQHTNEDGCDLRGDFYLENSAGGSAWTAYLTPIQSPSHLFPQIAWLPNGAYTVMGEIPHTASSCVHCGVDAIRVSRLGSAGTRFVCPTGWQCGPWTTVAPSSLFHNGFSGFPSIAVSSNGRVGVAATDFGGNVYLFESSDGSFAAGTVVTRTLTSYSDTQITAPDSTSTQYRPYIHCHIAYNDTTPHVVWSELQARKNGTSIVYVDYHSKIRHWDSITGVTTVKQVATGEADHFDDLDNGLDGPIAGFNTISVDWPQVGFATGGGETYVVWEKFVDSAIDPTADAGLPGIVTGVGFGDIAASVRTGTGSWSAEQNVTHTPNVDERYVSIAARNDGGYAHIVFQSSATNQAGIVQAQDRGTSSPFLPVRIAYLERRLTSSVVSVDDAPSSLVPRLASFPNPARGRVRFAWSAAAGPGRGATPANGRVLVTSITGQVVARLPIAGGGSTEWNGRDHAGRTAPSGLYLARIEGDAKAPALKFMWLR